MTKQSHFPVTRLNTRLYNEFFDLEAQCHASCVSNTLLRHNALRLCANHRDSVADERSNYETLPCLLD